MVKEEKSTSLSLINSLKSFIFALKGIVYAAKPQQNTWIHLVATFTVIALSCVYKASTTEWIYIIFVISFALYAELYDTFVEKIVDLMQPVRKLLTRQTQNIVTHAFFIEEGDAMAISLMFLSK